ncbi:MFS transporter [Mangrovactinospora gilvigrisea]|uniref:MFS transporter n=1 Tax=Mangrovactinospora gilvigrisea TaxID=1428644 RepID=A0A1J7C0D5_9ACTN|nr:DHA2 family efflux MFS transporter permease subunit [Mangrovactinospora gilvigrisea]OIV39185.1 MFS transporter [Mangrovactinospora gilvigrisea]
MTATEPGAVAATTADAASPPSGARHPGLVWTFVITSLAGFMAGLDNLVVVTALPAISKDLGAHLGALEWTVNGYTLPFATLLLIGATAGERFGRRRVFTLGLAIFTLASAGAALAGGSGTLIAARAVQGAGAALLMPLSLTILTAAAPANRRGLVFGGWGAVNGLSIAVGPLVGGALVDHASWHWIFWLNVPIGLVLVPLARLRLAEGRGPARRLDLPGVALAGAGLFGLVFGIVRADSHGWTSAGVLGPLIGGGVLVIAFLLWERRAPHPMLPLRLFRDRTFTFANAATLLMMFGMFGAVFWLTQYLQNIQGFSPQEAGVRMLPWTAVPMVVAPVAGVLADRIGGRPVIALGLLTQAVALGWLAQLASPTAGYGPEVIPLILGGIGNALFFAPMAGVVMGTVPEADQGMASGTNNMLRELGGALGVAVLSSVFAAHGALTSPSRFVDGLTPTVWTGAAVAALAAATMLLARPRPRAGA